MWWRVLVRLGGNSVVFAVAIPVERDGEVGADAGLGEHGSGFGVEAQAELHGDCVWGEGAEGVDYRFGGWAG